MGLTRSYQSRGGTCVECTCKSDLLSSLVSKIYTKLVLIFIISRYWLSSRLNSTSCATPSTSPLLRSRGLPYMIFFVHSRFCGSWQTFIYFISRWLGIVGPSNSLSPTKFNSLPPTRSYKSRAQLDCHEFEVRILLDLDNSCTFGSSSVCLRNWLNLHTLCFTPVSLLLPNMV